MENCEQTKVECLSSTVGTAINGVVNFMRKELIFRGILFLLLGFLLMFRPGPTMLVITIAIGAVIVLEGISMLISALLYHGQGKIFHILHAVLFILLGIFTCTAPLKMDLIWVMMIGFWQLFSGFQCFSFVKSAGMSAVFSGIFSVIAGLFLILMPITGMLALMWVMGIISFVSGISAILLGVRLRKALK